MGLYTNRTWNRANIEAMKFDRLLKRITTIIEWYIKTKPNETQVVNMIDKMDELSGLLWLMADFTSDAKLEYNQKYFVYKIETAREKMNLVKTGLAVNKADTEALLSKETEYELQLEAEAVCYKADLLMRQGNRILDSMRTRISYFKAEASYERTA